MAKQPAQAPKQRFPWDPVELELHEISAIKAIAAQHATGFEAILKICRVDEMSFTAGGEDGRRATDYAEGKRAVGITLRNVATMKMPSSSRGAPPELPNSPTPPAPADKKP